MSSALLISLLLADTPSPLRTDLHEEVVVVAERSPQALEETPAAVSVLTRAEIEARPAHNLADLLDGISGLQVLLAGDQASVPMLSARGFFGGGEAEYVRLLVDGVPVADVESGLADWREIRAGDIERIEVMHGPGSSLYGDTALGGVVQVFTRGATSADMKTEAQVSAGSFGTWQGEARGRRGWGATRLDVSAHAGHTDGFRAHSDSDEGGLLGSLAHGLPDAGWRLTLAASRRDRAEPGPLALADPAFDADGSSPLFAHDREATDRSRLGFLYAGRRGPVPYEANLQLAVRDTRFLRTLLLAPELGDSARRRVSALAWSASVQSAPAFSLSGAPARLHVGLELGRDTADTHYDAVSPDGVIGATVAGVSARRLRVAAFAMQDWRPRTRLRLVAGLRFDRLADSALAEGAPVSQTSRQAWSPHLAASVQLAAAVSAFARISGAFKAPTLDQRYDPRPFPDFAGGSFTLSNPALRPQRARSAELGLVGSGKRIAWQAAAYRIGVDDEIDFDPATFRYMNIGRSLHRGLELEVRARGRIAPSLGYTFTQVESRDPEHAGHQLKNVPRHLARAGLETTLPGGVAAGLRFAYVGRRFLDDDGQFPLPAHVCLDGRLSRAFGRARLTLDARNALRGHWAEVGYVLTDFTGMAVPYAYPNSPLDVRATVSWDF